MRPSRGTAPLAALALLSCFSEAPAGVEPPGTDVVIVEMTDGLAFAPAHVEIRAGQTIRWRNVSATLHTSTGDPDLAADPSSVSLPEGASTWHSGNLSPGAVFEIRLDVAGDYRYTCLPHESAGMTGTIRVLP
ncbi:MAG TPA: plastocyanin/azurin family copper-binding protein [Longimicrobiales bacterium]|nr:plastocyanin/azurin family copper-binding protein [Longimicrobiales bacterium]